MGAPVSRDPGQHAGTVPRMERHKLLVVQPDSGIRALLARTLALAGYAPLFATSGEEAIDLAVSGEIRVVLLDLTLPGMSGLETVRALRAMAPPPEVVVTTVRRSVDAIAEATRGGAFEFVPQPFDLEQLSEVLRAAYGRALGQSRRVARAEYDRIPEIIGRSTAISQVLTLIHRAAPTLSPVLIHGESGTGKELVARALHALSSRAKIPLTVLDCGALQDTLLESELFGHERGAFTGAQALKHGLFETANHGTVFLDEIGEMSPVMQVKVLRAVQSGEFRRVGSNQLIRADVRIIAATNRDLWEEVKRGRFREDLYYRIAVIEIRIPPLRERTEDIPLLVEHFLRTGASGGRPPLRIAPKAMECLTTYAWPGNIRELRNCVERVCVLADKDVVTVDALPPNIIAKSARSLASSDEVEDLSLAEVERRHILGTLAHHHWNRKRAAAALGIDTKTLYNKLRRYGISPSGREDTAP